jgi:hypothetical protein
MEVIENPVKFEEELRINKLLSYRDWVEIRLLEDQSEKEFCYRCNKPLDPLSWFDPDFFTLPCWDCMGKRKSEREVMVENIQRNIKDFYFSKIQGDRYFQLFIVDSIYFTNTIPHRYSEFKKVLSKLELPSRNDVWFLDWKAGFPKIISEKNIDGIKVVNLSSKYSNIELGKTKVVVDDYEIIMPEEVKPDTRHRTRYGIFSKGNDNRRSKRIKIGDRCYRLYNTDEDNVKSIFKILKGGEEIAFRSLSYQDYVILKLALMRDRSFLKFVFEILIELSRQVEIYRDSVFLRNTVLVDPKKTNRVNIVWNPISEEVIKDYINISVL